MPQTQWTASTVKASTQLMVSELILAQLWTPGLLIDVLHQGFFLLFMGLLSLLYLICALRTNMVFVTIFFGLFMCFVLLTGSYWNIAIDQAALGAKLQIASGAFAFLACLAGWWVIVMHRFRGSELTTSAGGSSSLKCSLQSTFHSRFPLATLAISFVAGPSGRNKRSVSRLEVKCCLLWLWRKMEGWQWRSTAATAKCSIILLEETEKLLTLQ